MRLHLSVLFTYILFPLSCCNFTVFVDGKDGIYLKLVNRHERKKENKIDLFYESTTIEKQFSESTFTLPIPVELIWQIVLCEAYVYCTAIMDVLVILLPFMYCLHFMLCATKERTSLSENQYSSL